MPAAASDARARDDGAELESKLATIRALFAARGLGAARFRRHDWFAWATCGASNAVVTTTQEGVAELFVTRDAACVLTDTVEAARLRQEELPAELDVAAFAWGRPQDRERYVRTHARGDTIASDAPRVGERPLPDALRRARRRLHREELERYRLLGRETAEAVSETLAAATPTLTERALAGYGAEALYRRGIHPALVLVAGGRRLMLYRHPLPTEERLGERAMLVVCGRRHGLYANLTRFVSFGEPTTEERQLAQVVATVEAVAWDASVPGHTLGQVFEEMVTSYARLGCAGAERQHHQGGLTGYLSREAFAVRGSRVVIEPRAALAWNPSLPGAKIEDTVVVSEVGLEVLTRDPAWPTLTVQGRDRPDQLVLG
jgi:Xaa-Pro aminopeptidase